MSQDELKAIFSKVEVLEETAQALKQLIQDHQEALLKMSGRLVLLEKTVLEIQKSL